MFLKRLSNIRLHYRKLFYLYAVQKQAKLIYDVRRIVITLEMRRGSNYQDN